MKFKLIVDNEDGNEVCESEVVEEVMEINDDEGMIVECLCSIYYLFDMVLVFGRLVRFNSVV